MIISQDNVAAHAENSQSSTGTCMLAGFPPQGQGVRPVPTAGTSSSNPQDPLWPGAVQPQVVDLQRLRTLRV